jgi:tRNA 2-thiouridine synthesizing protein A
MDSVEPVRLDCRRLLCPMPVIRVQDQVALLDPGTLLEAVCTDPGALQDIPAWCRINGHEVLKTYSTAGEHCVLMKVGPQPRSSHGRD